MTRARAESRELLLEKGWELLLRSPVNNAFQHVKATDVAKAAGVSAGAFYYHFPSHEDFIEALLDYGLAPERFQTFDAVANRMALATLRGAKLEELIRVAANLDFDILKDSDDFSAQVALWAFGKLDPSTALRLRTMYAASEQRYTPVFQAVLEAYGLELRPPFTLEHLATALAALTEGLSIRWAVDPDAVPDAMPMVKDFVEDPRVAQGLDKGDWNFFGTLACALLVGMTVPRGAATPAGWKTQEDVRSLFRRRRQIAASLTPE